MFKVLVLAGTTFKELLREKIFFVVVFSAVILFSLSILLGALSISEQQKIMADFGFFAIHITCGGISLFMGSYIISKEIEKQTCLLVLSRPINRDQFLIAKILGIVGVNTMLNFSLAVILWLLLGSDVVSGKAISFLEICFSLWMESLLLLVLAILFSMAVRPILALCSSLVIFLLGQGLDNLAFFAQKSKDEGIISLVKFLKFVVPNLYKMNWKSFYYLENGIPLMNFFWMLIHFTGWVLFVSLLASFLFRRKDIV